MFVRPSLCNQPTGATFPTIHAKSVSGVETAPDSGPAHTKHVLCLNSGSQVSLCGKIIIIMINQTAGFIHTYIHTYRFNLKSALLFDGRTEQC